VRVKGGLKLKFNNHELTLTSQLIQPGDYPLHLGDIHMLYQSSPVASLGMTEIATESLTHVAPISSANLLESTPLDRFMLLTSPLEPIAWKFSAARYPVPSLLLIPYPKTSY